MIIRACFSPSSLCSGSPLIIVTPSQTRRRAPNRHVVLRAAHPCRDRPDQGAYTKWLGRHPDRMHHQKYRREASVAAQSYAAGWRTPSRSSSSRARRFAGASLRHLLGQQEREEGIASSEPQQEGARARCLASDGWAHETVGCVAPKSAGARPRKPRRKSFAA